MMTERRSEAATEFGQGPLSSPSRQRPSEALLRRVFAGDREAARELIEGRERIYHPALRRRFGTTLVAHKLEGILEDGWRRIFGRLGEFLDGPGTQDFDVWAFQVICQCAWEHIDRFRRGAGLEPEVIPEMHDSPFNPGEGLEGRPSNTLVESLIPEFMAGDQDATLQLVEALSPKFQAALARKFSNSAIAHRLDDILQEGWTRIFQHRRSFDPDRGRIDAWAYRIILNSALKNLSRMKLEGTVVSFDLATIPVRDEQDDESDVGAGEAKPRGVGEVKRLADFREVIGRLPDIDQKMLAFYSSYPGDNWQADYAEQAGIKPGTLRSRFSRVKARIRKEMQAKGWLLDNEETTGRTGLLGVEAWLDTDEEPLWIDETYQLSVEVTVPNSPGNSEAKGGVVVSVASPFAEAHPLSQVVGPSGSKEPGHLNFKFRPTVGGSDRWVDVEVLSRKTLARIGEVRVSLPQVKYRLDSRRP